MPLHPYHAPWPLPCPTAKWSLVGSQTHHSGTKSTTTNSYNTTRVSSLRWDRPDPDLTRVLGLFKIPVFNRCRIKSDQQKLCARVQKHDLSAERASGFFYTTFFLYICSITNGADSWESASKTTWSMVNMDNCNGEHCIEWAERKNVIARLVLHNNTLNFFELLRYEWSRLIGATLNWRV